MTGEVGRKSRVTPWKASQENDSGRKAWPGVSTGAGGAGGSIFSEVLGKTLTGDGGF